MILHILINKSMIIVLKVKVTTLVYYIPCLFVKKLKIDLDKDY